MDKGQKAIKVKILKSLASICKNNSGSLDFVQLNTVILSRQILSAQTFICYVSLHNKQKLLEWSSVCRFKSQSY